ncbi:MAG: hypothetical protein WCS72_14320 [Deltaproteobacteria bacterium]
MRKHGRKLVTAAVLIAATAIPGAGHAQVPANPNYYIKGSDTLFDIMTASINAAKAKNVLPTTSPTLIYDGTGSGNAENEMKSTSGTAAGRLGVQSIGPMSRNFRPATVTQFPSWQPGLQNIVALDAAVVMSFNGTQKCKNYSLPLLSTDGTKAAPNTATLPVAFGTTGSGYDQILEIILSGIDGTGSTAACADPRRVQAIADLAACQGVSAINHFYRRDDNSGTTDTFKDKIMRGGAGGRFCNGAALGSLGGNKAHPNLNNQDLDPIRRPCDVSSATRSQVTCTDVTTGALCNSSAATCTQGFITALSENDGTISDITVTIGARVAADSTGATMGFAGREGAKVNPNANAAFVNTNPPTNDLVRLDSYMLARRLFLQRGPANPTLDAGVDFNATNTAPPPAAGPPAGCLTTPPTVTGAACGNQRVNNTAVLTAGLTCPDGSANLCAGGGTTQRGLEDTLFNYMTDPGGSASPDGAPGRCNTDPIVVQYGFIPCLDSCLDTPTGSANLCSKSPYTNPASPPSACFPAGFQTATGVVSWSASATPAPLWAAVTTGATGTCCTTGVAAVGGACPAGNTSRGANFACSTPGTQAECATGLACTNLAPGLDVGQ